MRRGFLDDLSHATQSRRARMGDITPQTQAARARKNLNSPWRRTAGATTERARMSQVNYNRRGKGGNK